MKKTFLEYYKPTDAQMKIIWDKCIFVFDANVLLNLYKSSDKVRKKFLNFFEANKNRIWIPHQFAFEYHKNRLKVIFEQEKAFNEVIELIEGWQKKISGDMTKFRKHPTINIDTYTKKIDGCFLSICKNIKGKHERHPKWLKEDSVRNKITKFFNSKVGRPYKNDEMIEICKKGEERFTNKIPPGFCDKSKDDNKFGDLIGWYQIIDKARESKKPIIFVTEEEKDDWWQRLNDEKIGPRYELIRELFDASGMSFWMFSMERFSKHAKFESDIIDEIQKLVDIPTLDENTGGAHPGIESPNEKIAFNEAAILTNPDTGTTSHPVENEH